MIPEPQTEEIPYPHMVSSLNEMINQRTADLAMANARISVRDQIIVELRRQIEELQTSLDRWESGHHN